MTDLEDVSQSLGIEVKRDKAAVTIELSHGEYTLLVKCLNMSDCNAVHVPGIRKELSAHPEGNVPLNETMTKLYQAIVGSLFFLPNVQGTTWLSVRCKQLVTW